MLAAFPREDQHVSTQPTYPSQTCACCTAGSCPEHGDRIVENVSVNWSATFPTWCWLFVEHMPKRTCVPTHPPGAQQYASWLTWFLFKLSYENQFISSPRHVPVQSISWLAAGLVLNCVLFAWLSVHQEPFLLIPPTCVPLAAEQPGAQHDSSWLGGDLVLNCPSLCGMCLKICTSLSNICLFHRRGLLHLRGFNRNRIIPLQSHGCDKRALDYSSSTRPHTAWSFLRMANTTATRPHQCEECGMGGTCEVSIVGFIFRGLLQISTTLGLTLCTKWWVIYII